jgi:hypothetical protein
VGYSFVLINRPSSHSSFESHYSSAIFTQPRCNASCADAKLLADPAPPLYRGTLADCSLDFSSLTLYLISWAPTAHGSVLRD